MKRFTLLILVLVLFISLGLEAEAAPWWFVCVADEIDASVADTFYVNTGRGTKAFRAIAYNQNAMTPTADGAWTFAARFTAGKVGSAYQYPVVMGWREGTLAAVESLAIGNARDMITLVTHAGVDGENGDLARVIPGNTLRLIYTPNSATGGSTSFYIWFQALE